MLRNQNNKKCADKGLAFIGAYSFKTIDKPSSVVYGHLSTNNVAAIPQRYLLNRFGETPV